MDDLKAYSCVSCRQRKVRCDRRAPCMNCTKAERQCDFVAPVRGKRKRTKPPRETLHARLRRYESMLRAYGAKIEPSDGTDGSDSETESHSLNTPVSSDGTMSIVKMQDRDDPMPPKFIMKEGTSRYYDRYGWRLFQHPESAPHYTDPAEEDVNDIEDGLMFEPERGDKVMDLAKYHLPLPLISKLKDFFVDRVDPMMKFLHLPTFWTAITNELQNPGRIPKSLEALIFSFYLVSICSLKEDEARELFDVEQTVLLYRYRTATRQALVNARFLSTANLMTLQAFSIFIICVRNIYRCDTLFVLSGVAIRLARKMGLHRDGTFLGLPPFETEMRRRLWWHIAHIDFRTADVMGTKPSPEISTADTKHPINVEDSELYPGMTALPEDHNGITGISLAIIKCEMIASLCKCAATRPIDLRWEMLYSPDISLATKDSVIDEVEDHMEKKYLRHCDPLNPFHTFLSIMVRSAVCKMRLFAHNLRQFAPRYPATQQDHDLAFQNAMKLLEYAGMVQGGHMGLDKYLWQIGTSYCWNTMLYLLMELRYRKFGPEVDKSWKLIGVVFARAPEVFSEFTGSVYVALGKWTLEVWDDHVAASKAEGLPEPVPPDYIHAIRDHQKSKLESETPVEEKKGNPKPVAWPPTTYDKASYVDYLDVNYSEPHNFPNLSSFDTDPNQWLQWEQLVADQSTFT
ncbi:fungal-specific transcription factor domain-containing protein [Trichoderma sp. SZMC 28014]